MRKCKVCNTPLKGAQLKGCSRYCRNKIAQMERYQADGEVQMRNRFLLMGVSNYERLISNA